MWQGCDFCGVSVAGSGPGAVAGGRGRGGRWRAGRPEPARPVRGPGTAGGPAACRSAGASLRKSCTHAATYRLEPVMTRRVARGDLTPGLPQNGA